MNPLQVILVIARQTGMRLLRGRLLRLVLLGALVGAAVFALASRRIAPQTRGDVALGMITFSIYVQFVLPFCALFFGVQGLQGDLEDRTSVYLFVRPLPRWAILLGKWIAAALLSAAAVSLGVVALYYGLTLPGREWRSDIAPPWQMVPAFVAACALGASAYAALGALFGAWFQRPLIAGVVFLLGWEVAVANLARQASARSFTVMDPMRRLLWREHAARDEYADVLKGPFGIVPDPEALSPELSTLRFALVVLALAVWIYSRREYDARTGE